MKKLILLCSITLLIQGQSFANLPKTDQPQRRWSTSTVLVGVAGLAGVGFGGYYYDRVWLPSQKVERTQKVVKAISNKFDKPASLMDRKHSCEKFSVYDAFQLHLQIQDSYAKDVVDSDQQSLDSYVAELSSYNAPSTDDVQKLLRLNSTVKERIHQEEKRIEINKKTFWTAATWTSGIAAVVGLGYFFSKK